MAIGICIAVPESCLQARRGWKRKSFQALNPRSFRAFGEYLSSRCKPPCLQAWVPQSLVESEVMRLVGLRSKHEDLKMA